MLPTPSRAPPETAPAAMEKIVDNDEEQTDADGERSDSQTRQAHNDKSNSQNKNENRDNVERQSSADQTDSLPSTKNKERSGLRFRKFSDEDESDWWFASTAVPLFAATLGPLANVLSIAALVTYWRMDLVDPSGKKLGDLEGLPFRDPLWCYWLNAASLILGFVGNFFLLMNFTQRIRYIIALPATIILWYLATAILIAILLAMQVHFPPARPDQTYTQGFWYGVAAACLYLILSMLLMVNMLGCLLGHYPRKFELNDHQRTLILQTMLFFVWLAGGGAVFSRVETSQGQSGWGFVDALYFCDVTILTVGFGDLAPKSNAGRGLVFPYSVGGIIMLGLVISSIHYFVQELGADKVVKTHFEKRRQRTLGRAVANSTELRRREVDHKGVDPKSISGPSNPINLSELHRVPSQAKTAMGETVRRVGHGVLPSAIRPKKPKLLLLREEKDRFEAMRIIQRKTGRFKNWWALSFSLIAFGILWAVGAVVFWQCEKNTQGMTYFQAIYLCYVSLLTIGYGDLAPKSNPGRCFFVVWSLIAVPTMTVLVSDMGDTVISNFKKATWKLADFTVLPKHGTWKGILDQHPALLSKIQSWEEKRKLRKRRKSGVPTGPTDGDGSNSPRDIEDIAVQFEQDDSNAPSEHELARKLAIAIRKTAGELNNARNRTYTYEEWVDFTRLIRFTTRSKETIEQEEEEVEELIDWDWMGEDSPMMAGVSEAEFVLDRLCESMKRYIGRQAGLNPDEPRGNSQDN